MGGSPEGSSGGPVVIDSSDKTNVEKSFPNLLTAVSEIQRYAMIEREGEEIPVDFLTIGGQFRFFNVGMGSGLVHGMFYIVLSLFLLPILSDPILRAWVALHITTLVLIPTIN